MVLCMKGLEMGTGARLSQIAAELLHPSNTVAVWLGPGHVQEFYRGIPNCMVIDSENEDVKRRLVQAFSSDLIRFYYGGDMRWAPPPRTWWVSPPVFWMASRCPVSRVLS